MRSKPQVLAFQASLNQIKGIEGRFPTYEERRDYFEELVTERLL